MSQETVVLFSFPMPQFIHFIQPSKITAVPIISVCAESELRLLQLSLHLMPGGGLSSVLSNVLCAKKGEGLPNYVKWLEWLLGTCEESP